MSASGGFAEHANGLIESIIQLVLNAHNVIGFGFILLLLLQVFLVLAGMHLRDIRTHKQRIKLLLILFAVLIICSMTVWLLLKTMGTD